MFTKEEVLKIKYNFNWLTSFNNYLRVDYVDTCKTNRNAMIYL